MTLIRCPYCKARLYSKEAVQKHAQMGRPKRAYEIGQRLSIGDICAVAFRAGTHELRYKLRSSYKGYSGWYDSDEIAKLVRAMKHQLAHTA